MTTQEEHKPSCKMWIEYKGNPVLGKGGAEILEAISTENSLSKAAVKLRMSYRYVWNYLQKIQKAIGEPIVETRKGGKHGGGGAQLTPLGKSLLLEYKQLESYLNKVVSDMEHWKHPDMKNSVKNSLKGKVTAIEKSGETAKVKVELATPAAVTVLMPRKTAEGLALKVGDEVEIAIEATGVMTAK